jgi:hypothetical protein
MFMGNSSMDELDYVKVEARKKLLEYSCGKGTMVGERKPPYCGIHPIEHHVHCLKPPFVIYTKIKPR